MTLKPIFAKLTTFTFCVSCKTGSLVQNVFDCCLLLFQGVEPSCVWRNDSQSLGTGSYLWFDNSKLEVLGVVDMVSRIPESGIPNADFPSDHLSLKAVFSFLPIERQVASLR